MPNFDELLAQYIPPAPSETPVVPTAAAQTPDFYAMGAQNGSSLGAQTSSGLERDLQTLSTNQLYRRYGDAAQGLIAQRLDGERRYAADLALSDDQNRSYGELATDTLTGIGSGFLNSLGGVAALGLGVVNRDAGTWAAEKLEQGNNWLNDNVQSDVVNAARRVSAAATSLDERDNLATMKKDVADGMPEWAATLKRVGADTLDGFGNAWENKTMMGQGTAEAIGSLLGGGPISKGLKVAGRGVLSAIGRDVLAQSGRVAAVGERAAMPAAIGLMEGGGAYQQSAAEVMQMKHADLMKNSSAYRSLIASGMSQEDAKIEIANNTGLTAAAIQAPIAAATGMLVARFEANPFRVPSLTQGLANVAIKEPLEEGIQSATGQIAQNIAIRENADSTKDIAGGVGTQVSQGALYGFTAAGVVQSPGIAKRAVVDGAKATWQGVRAAGDRLVQRGDDFIRDMEKASPVADSAIATEAADAAVHAPNVADSIKAEVRESDAAPEAVAKADAYVDALMSHLQVSQEELADDTLAPNVREALESSATRVEAIQKLAQDVVQTNDADERIESAYFLLKQVERIDAFRMAQADALNSLPEDSASRIALNQYQNLIADIAKTPGVRNALREVRSMIEEVQQDVVTDDSVQTPEGQRAVDQAVTVAEAMPTAAKPEVLDAVLNQDAKGNLDLTTAQRAALRTARALIDSINTEQSENERLGLTPSKSDIVSGELIAFKDQGTKGPSLAQLTQAVLRQYRNGDNEGATETLNHLRDLTQHMQNKVAALNEHVAAGNPSGPRVSYQQLRPDGSWGTSPEKSSMYVNTKNANSVKMAQRIAMEANTLASVHNTLADALGLGSIVAPVALDTRVTAPAEQVVQPAATITPEPTATPVAEQNTIVEPVAEQANVVEETQPQEAAVSAMEQVYPDLLVAPHQTENLFVTSFDIPSEPKTHIMAEESPVDFVTSALSSSQNLRKVVGDSGKLDNAVARDYADYLSAVPEIIGTLQNNLKKFLNAPYSKTNSDKIGDLYLSNGVVKGANGNVYMGRFNTSARGKLLNIMQQTDDGLQYNQKLLESAVLAGMQWAIEAKNFQRPMDIEDILVDTGATNLDLDAASALSTGLSQLDVMDSLGTKIRQYWGLDTNPDAPIGLTDGIVQSMAAEVMRGLQSVSLMDKIDVTLGQAEGLAEPKTFVRFVPNNDMLAQFEGLKKFPQAIDTAVLTTVEPLNFIGADAVVPVAQTQMNNPKVKNTPDQLKVIENEQKTKYHFNQTMMNIYTSLGEDNIIRLFGADVSDVELLNVNHAKTVEGKNRTIAAAYQHLMDLFAEVGDIATPVKFAVNFSRVNRMQMLGKYNPQSNKIVREALLPTWDTVDLSTVGSPSYQAFQLGIGQAFGVKIHNMSRDAVAAEVNKKLAALEPVSELVRSLSTGKHVLTGTEAADIRNAFKAAGVDLGPVGLHAYSEWLRLQDTADRSAFRTAVYVEADGMTNGPINAMGLYSTGDYTAAWVKNIGKGGLFFQEGMTANKYRSEVDKHDLYQATVDQLKMHLTALRNRLTTAGAAPVITQQDHMLNLMNLFMPGDVIFDSAADFDNGGLWLSRNVTKNPLTITIYGSGQAGIANNVAQKIVKNIYERMSVAAEKQAADPSLSMLDALFDGNQVAAQQFVAAMDNLLDQVVAVEDGNWFITNETAKTKKGNTKSAKEFTISGDEFRNLQANILKLFVGPMHEAIRDTVGSNLLDGVDVMRKVGQAHSIILKDAYNRAVKEAVDSKETGANWNPTLFLSRNELDAIDRKMGKLQPFVRTGSQTYYTAGKSRQDLVATPFGGGFDGSMRIKPLINAPENSRVSTIPFMTIGMGDGMMMQHLSLDADVQGTLKIFDGMNIPLSKINEYSLKANQAVSESWKGNPFRSIHESFSKIDVKAAVSAMTADGQFELASALVGPYKAQKFSQAQIIEALTGQQNLLDAQANMVDARHATEAKVTTSLDQMASAGAPFQNKGIDITATTPEGIAAALNDVHYGRVQAAVKAEDFRQVGRAHSTGAQVLSYTALKNLTKSLDFTDAQKVMFGEIMRSQAARDYKVVYGTPEQVTAYQQANGLTVTPAQKLGSTSVAEKTIYLFTQSPETLVHELIHASSFEKVLAHYEGKASPEVSEAVTRIEALMEQFLDEDVSTPEQIAARAAVLDGDLGLDAMSKAKALNEFMAWGLTNQQMTEAAKKKQAPTLAKIATNVVKAIKQLIWGRKKAPAYADDALSSLQFNTGLIIRSAPTQFELTRRAVLNQNQFYSSSQRVEELGKMFSDKVAQFAKASNNLGAEARRASVTADLLNTATNYAFPMTKKESYTFSNIAAALATSMELDPAILARAQQLYTHTVKQLSVESFMPENPVDYQAAYYDAQLKYDLLAGKAHIGRDSLGRSTLMPMFVALSMVNDDFREVLSKIAPPKAAKLEGGSVDALLDSVGNTGLDYVAGKLTNDRNTKSVRESMDRLMDKLYASNIENDSYLDQAAASVGGVFDAANTYVSEGIEAVSNKIAGVADKVAQQTQNKLLRRVARVVEATAQLASETGAEAVAKGVTDVLNTNDVWRPFRDLMKDLIGRTDSNANVYDMIKQVRSLVQQIRQQFRENVPQIIAGKFTRDLTDQEWSDLHHGLGRTDVAALFSGMKSKDILNVLHDAGARKTEIASRVEAIRTEVGADFSVMDTKMKQLAHFMVTGEYGQNLLRNAYQVSRLFNETKTQNYKVPSQKAVQLIDELVSLYAIDMQSQSVRDSVANLAQTEGAGMEFAMAYLRGQRRSELTKKADQQGMVNRFKGYIPTMAQESAQIIVADDADYAKLKARSYERIGDYAGSSLETVGKRGYYYMPVSGRALFNQGIFQNIRHTTMGVDSVNGFSTSTNTAGRITNPNLVRALAKNLKKESVTREPLLPIYNERGVIVAFERTFDPSMSARLERNTHFGKMVGVWRGRQVEESKSEQVNNALVDRLHEMWSTAGVDANQYVNIMNHPDPVIQDAVRLLTPQSREYIENRFGAPNQLMVRKDLVEDVTGYRNASVGDAWSGNTRWSDTTMENVKKAVVGLFGDKAYRYAVNGERVLQNFVQDARTVIVVKSVIVPVSNMISNVYQMIGRGVPMLDIARGFPRKTMEINSYVNSQIRKIEAEAELVASTDRNQQNKLRAEIQSINDSHKRLSIWPLIEAGEFTAIADAGITHDDVQITSGRLNEYLESLVQKLPEEVRTLGRYALVTKDTALFQGLQKTIQYGDFIAKAIQYDDLVKRQKKTKEYALGRISEEFVNYDRLPGRFRGYLESIGLLWFYNFKIRSVKVAASMLRNNPLHSLFALALPSQSPFGNIGTPIEDNLISKLGDGSLSYSTGLGQAFRAPLLNPWVNLVN
ncbi:single subunit virion RNA polymerase [Stenotrophomonas phage Philippe]|uniref:Single subunit virion RNA polymerase n=1 Tax=Stenotrophomonas phage Philippe TaxID=2859655 RepID=A0AAE7WNF9_9CAUD|nr:single subunit virion RNA polymerase [Stenotrophomonas phage Philippe]QYW02270.1 single subunit virion RNA polymerase [Stenotrophomonas phage Philippe]